MKIGFIGAGNMGSAIINGLLLNQVVPADSIVISRRNTEASGDFAKRGVRVISSNQALASECDIIVMAVKPVYAQGVFDEIRDSITHQLIISIMAGWTCEMLSSALPEGTHYIRVMPNMPLAVGEGMTLLSDKGLFSENEFSLTRQIFGAAGKVIVVEDRIFTAATSISGCGPAFVYQFIEALADGGVQHGVPRAIAYQLAAQTLIGASKMVLETGKHPGALKDEVCSPGGTTIEGVYALEKGGMRAAVMDALGATISKTQKMQK